jgi:Flp pilus assembly protein TadB
MGAVNFSGAMARLAHGANRFRRVAVDDQRALVEAVAVWTENLRDSMTASSGIEQAISDTARHAPSILSEDVNRLVASLRYRRIDEALREFAHALGNPTSDFVIAALILSIGHHTRDFIGLLTHLSDAARAETDLYTRIWVSRARSRTAVRIITGSVASFVVGLVLLNPLYLRPFLTPTGLVVLSGICLSFGCGLVWLRSMTSLDPPPRFLHQEQAPT